MALTIDLTDKLTRLPIAYGWQPVRGWAIKHFDTATSNSTQRTKQNALGEGPWESCEKLWIDGFEIPSSDFVFHPGIGVDSADIHFPSEPSHPWIAYISSKLKVGLTEDQTTALYGVYKTLRTGDYDGAGNQLNSAGAIVTPSDPKDEFFFKPNPANVAADQILRWGKRSNTIINWPAWVDWKDFNDELIPWDDSLYTPRSLSLTPTGGGTLTPGQTYYVRVATMKGGDESSASLLTLETKENSIELLAGQTAFQVSWLIKGDELSPAVNPEGITGYRIYIGTTPGMWLGYFLVSNPSARSFLVSTTTGVTGGNPLDLATSGLLRQIKRFECGLFFTPPYDLATALDRICQISCSDWQWSGLGTGTYRNDKIRFLSPANRAPVFTLNLAETSLGSFKTFPIDRRNRPNQIIVNFRDRDNEFLNEGQPVILDREQLQIDDKQTKAFVIEAGTVYRSQAQRIASFYARVLCDMDQMAEMISSPKSYHLLPGDVINVTNDTPDWTDVKFVVRKKGENIEARIGDTIAAQLYTDNLYSDSDYSPLPRPLPSAKFDPFESPPLVTNVTLSEILHQQRDGVIVSTVQGIIQFAPFHTIQRGRVWVRRPGVIEYEPTHLIITPESSTNQGAFLVTSVAQGTYRFKVVTENVLGDHLGTGDGLDVAQEYSIFVQGKTTGSSPVSNFILKFDGTHIEGLFTPPPENDVKQYDVFLVTGGIEGHILSIGVGTHRFIYPPPKGWNSTLTFKIYVWNRSNNLSTPVTQTITPVLPGAGNFSSPRIVGKHTANGDFFQALRVEFTFPTYTFGKMYAKFFLTAPGESETDIGQTLTPRTQDNATTVWVPAQGKGLHTLRGVVYLEPTDTPSSSSASIQLDVQNQSFVLSDIPDGTLGFRVTPQSSGVPASVKWDLPPDYEKIAFFELYQGLTGGIPDDPESLQTWYNGGAGQTLLYKGRENKFTFALGQVIGNLFVRTIDNMGNVSRFFGPALFNIFSTPNFSGPTISVDTSTSNSKIIAIHVNTPVGYFQGIVATRVQIRQQGGSWPSFNQNTNGQLVFAGLCREVVVPWATAGQTVEIRVMFDGTPSSDWSSTLTHTLPA